MGGQEKGWRFTSPRGTFENAAVHGHRTPNRAGHEHLRKTRKGRLPGRIPSRVSRERRLLNKAGWVFPSARTPERPLYPQVKNSVLRAPHSIRHTMRLAEAGATPDVARTVLRHRLTQSVSERCITSHLLVAAVRRVVNRVAEC